MNATLCDLLERMSVHEEYVDSSNSVSWNAHREAEAITDEKFVDDIESILRTTKLGDKKRRACYFILGVIASTGSYRACELLIIGAGIEKNKYMLSSLLDSLAKSDLPASLKLDNIYRLLLDKRWLVRHSAILALKGSQSLETEEHILKHLSETSDPYDQTYCHSTLYKIGSPKAIPFLEKSLTSRKRDVKYSAQTAIQSICDRHHLIQ